MHDARPSLFIFAVLSAVLRSGFRDTAVLVCTLFAYIVGLYQIAVLLGKYFVRL